MALYHSQRQSVRQNQALQARQIALSVMLQRSGEAFEQALTQEARDNPALEIEERTRCPRCGTRLNFGFCSLCDALERGGKDGTPGRWNIAVAQLAAWSDGDWLDERDDVIERAQARESLAAWALRQLRAALPREDFPIAAYLTGSLDDRGFLTSSCADVADALHVDVARVERALAVLQTMDPPGVGSRTVGERLLLQLAHLEEQGSAPPIARRMLERCLTDLAQHRFDDIARALGVSVAEAREGWAFIRERLSPYPGQAPDASAPGVNGLWSEPGMIVPLWPDVVFRRTETGYEAEVLERRRYRLAVQPLYAELRAGEGASGVSGRATAYATATSHIQTYVARTEEFLSLVQRRWETLGVISSALIALQYDFLERGTRYLRPLTRTEVALRLKISESTVSRAISGKYALLPTGRIVPFEVFFDASLAIKDRLIELVEGEDSARPLHDDELARLLDDQGVRLATRTVAKYREALGIAPPRLRAILRR